MIQEVRSTQANTFAKGSFILLLLMLFLRFPVLFAASRNLLDQNLLLVLFLCGTYLCTGLFLCINRKSLYVYNLTASSLVLFFLAPIAALSANGTDPTAWFRFILAMVFAIFLVWKKGIQLLALPLKETILHTCITIIASIALAIIIWAVEGFVRKDSLMNPVTLNSIARNFCFQFSFAAISEEPLFRGFLWGYLRKRISNEWIISILIAFIFWMGHLYYIERGIVFWLIHPVMALFLSVTVKWSKSVSQSMLLHTSVNAIHDILPFL